MAKMRITMHRPDFFFLKNYFYSCVVVADRRLVVADRRLVVIDSCVVIYAASSSLTAASSSTPPLSQPPLPPNPAHENIPRAMRRGRDTSGKGL